MFRWAALVAAVVFVLASAGYVLSSEKPAETSQQPATEKSEKRHDAEKSEIALFDRWFPDSTAVFNLFLMIFTGILAFGGLYQLKLLTRAEGIATSTAEAAKESADAAKKAADVAQKTLFTTQGALIVLTTLETTSRPAVDNSVASWTLSMKFTNAGNTTAKAVRSVSVRHVFADGIIPDDFDLTPPPDAFGRDPVSIDMPPRTPLNTEGQEISIADIQRVKTGPAKLLYWGRIEYRDIFFPETPQHWLDFCFLVEIVRDPLVHGFPGGPLPFLLHVFKRGNSSG